MRRGTPPIASVGKTLAMLEAVLANGDSRAVTALARAQGIAPASAHRQVKTLLDERYLSKLEDGGHVAGPRLLELLRLVDEKQVLANVASGILDKLAGELGCVVQLGTLENAMVTYRVKAGQGAGSLFTKVDMQLEAYCSGIGKVLLAWLPETERDAYLANGPFPRLTPRTICDPGALAAELGTVRERGFAVDNGEIDEGIFCVAVPVRRPDGTVPAAVSASEIHGQRIDDPAHIERLKICAASIERLAFC